MSVILCSYADSGFAEAQRLQQSVARLLGFNLYLPFSRSDLQHQFCLDNEETLSYARGAGYWIWKPEIIFQACEAANFGDTIVYLDAGVLPLRKSKYFENISKDNRMHLWSGRKSSYSTNRHWIDDLVCEELFLNEEFLNSTHAWAGLICFRKSSKSLQIIREWGELCGKPNLLRPDSNPNYKPSKDIIWHRHDQSLLNVVINRHKNHINIHSLPADYSQMWHQRAVVLAHRSGQISNLFSLILFILARRIKRILIFLLPSTLRKNLINISYTKSKKATISSEERNSHSKLYQYRSKER